VAHLVTRAYNEDEMLRQLAQDLRVTERPQRAFGIEIGTRMTVVRLADGTLFVHSPVALDRATRLALDALGPVRHVVAPNRVPPSSRRRVSGGVPRRAFLCGARCR